jgi:hypothetical protein
LVPFFVGEGDKHADLAVDACNEAHPDEDLSEMLDTVAVEKPGNEREEEEDEILAELIRNHPNNRRKG